MQTRDDETRGGRGCRTESNDFSPALLETRLRFVSKGNFVSREEEVDRHVRWTRNESGRQIPIRRASLLPLPLFTHESYVSSIATFDSPPIGIIGVALDKIPPSPRMFIRIAFYFSSISRFVKRNRIIEITRNGEYLVRQVSTHL